jgi:hypothetical protein
MTATVENAPDLPPPRVPPASLGLSCPACQGTEFTTCWQTFKDGTRHARLDCARCKRYVRYLPRGGPPGAPDFQLRRRPADAHRCETAPPPPGWVWIGYLRSHDGLWRPVAMAEDLAGLWNALLGSWQVGDVLAVPVMPPTPDGGAK